jgi:hypothetical protein
MKPETKFAQYIDYINNTGKEPLSVSAFDEDWEPVGPMVRRDMVAAELIQERADGIYLRPDLWRRR